MPEERAGERRYFLDNIRSAAIVLVVVYHIAYIFNSAGVVSNIPVRGIREADAICYFVYPWIMCLMFLVAGISARYSLQKRGEKHFLRERLGKLVLPFFGGVFLLGWLNGWVTSRYVDFFGGREVSPVVKYLFYSLNIGPQWFLLELFLGSVLLLLMRRLDRKDRLWALAGRAGMPLLLSLALPVWASSYVLNTPLVIVFRNGIYWFVFLLGYYVFSHDAVLEKTKRYALPLLAAALVLGCVEVWYFFGKDYASDACLKHPLTNLYLWTMILAILGCGQKYFDFSNAFTKNLNKRSFGIYVCHYPLQVTAAYFILTYLKPPMAALYLLLLPISFGAAFFFYEITVRIPVIRTLLYGTGQSFYKKPGVISEKPSP